LGSIQIDTTSPPQIKPTARWHSSCMPTTNSCCQPGLSTKPTFNPQIRSRNMGKFQAMSIARNMTQAAMIVFLSGGQRSNIDPTCEKCSAQCPPEPQIHAKRMAQTRSLTTLCENFSCWSDSVGTTIASPVGSAIRCGRTNCVVYDEYYHSYGDNGKGDCWA